MSTQDASSKGGSAAGHTALKGHSAPVCPQCQSRMKVDQVTPVLFASDFDDVTFGCEKCGAEVKRTVKRT